MAQGEGRSLDEAFNDAWKNIPAGEKRKVHTATMIQVWGNNPINGYRVILTPQDR